MFFFAHMTSSGVKPNEKSYSLLVDAHLINRDTKSALGVVKDMMLAGYSPSKETLKKLRRRCVREFDVDGKTTAFSGHVKVQGVPCHNNKEIDSAIQTEPKCHISWEV